MGLGHFQNERFVYCDFFLLFYNEGKTYSIVSFVLEPQEVDVKQEFTFNLGEEYDVHATFSWSPPCYINGPLRRYDYRIEGSLRGVESSDCKLVIEEGTITEDLVNPSIETNKLNPYLDYTLYITTVIYNPLDDTQTLSSDTVVPVDRLPPPYHPPAVGTPHL